METIGIFYFSGTGNTEIVSRLLCEALKQRGKKVELYRMEDILKNKLQIDFNKFDVIGLGHPVFGFGASGIVDEFADKLPFSAEAKAFIFKTASSHHYVNHGASDSVLSKIEKKGYKVFYNTILAMPCNWFIKYSDSMNKQLYEAAVRKTKRIADEIANEKSKILKINPVLRSVLKGIYYLEEQKGAKYYADGLRTTAECVMCKKCINDCPTNNITEEQGNIHFGLNCIWCMRCIYSCPQNAIYAKNLPSCVLKPFTGGFNIDKLINNPSIKGNFVTDNSKGYYKHFIKYFKED